MGTNPLNTVELHPVQGLGQPFSPHFYLKCPTLLLLLELKKGFGDAGLKLPVHWRVLEMLCFPSALCPGSLVTFVFRSKACWLPGEWCRERREKGCLRGKDQCGRECVPEVGVCVMGIGMFLWARTPICGVFFPIFLGFGCVQINWIQNAPFLAL